MARSLPSCCTYWTREIKNGEQGIYITHLSIIIMEIPWVRRPVYGTSKNCRKLTLSSIQLYFRIEFLMIKIYRPFQSLTYSVVTWTGQLGKINRLNNIKTLFPVCSCGSSGVDCKKIFETIFEKPRKLPEFPKGFRLCSWLTLETRSYNYLWFPLIDLSSNFQGFKWPININSDHIYLYDI